jgi:heterodisulfide reductase subunit A-like polyferredoxin
MASALNASIAAVTQAEHPHFNVKSTHDGVVPVGILGGGMAGLYAAMMLAQRKIPFQILEATDRVGGRCYTYNFPGGGEWDYYVIPLAYCRISCV